MKTTTIKTVFAPLALALAFAAIPASAADDASVLASVKINSDGVAHVLNAEVTSVSGNLINAITRFKTSVANWVFTTNASTTVRVNNSNATTTAGIQVGDRIDVSGTLTSIGSTLGIAATNVRDVTLSSVIRVKSGTVQSVNTSNGTFVLKSNDKSVTVQTNASTTFAIGTTTQNTLANLAVNAKVAVTGVMNADTSVMTASKVMLVGVEGKMKEIKDKIKEKESNNGAGHGLKLGWLLQKLHLSR